MFERLSRSMRTILLFAIALLTVWIGTIGSTLMTAEPSMAESQPTQIFSGVDLTFPHESSPLSLTHQEPNFYQ